MPTATKNLCGKTRKVNEPYEIWRLGTWEWRVLKKWQSPENEKTNPYARWFCAVKSPMTMGSYDMGDVYIHEITEHAHKLTKAEMEEVLKTERW